MSGVLLCCLACWAHRGAPLAGVLLCSSVHQTRLMSQPHYCSDARCWHVVTEAMVMAPPSIRDSVVSPCFHGCPAFLHRHVPPRSPPSHPLDPSLHSQHQPSPWDGSTVPKFQLPATVPSRGPASLFMVCMPATRTV